MVCRIVLQGFRPCRDVGDLRGARCVRISATVEPPQCGVIVVEPPQCDGSTAFATARSCQGCRGFRRSLRSQRLRSCLECRGFRCSLRSQRNGGGAPEGTGGDGRRGKRLRQRHAPARRPSPFLLPACGAPFRLWRTIPRNAAALSGISRFTICDLRLTTYEKGLWSKVSGFRFQVYDMRCELRLETHTASERRHARSAINTIRSVVMGMPAPVTGISERCY